ncbi:hypothetical protein H4582DRAFT_2063604 [Lactarius indigo]|nr:hypothetical protein H4582DRAFT_2063604 [Lactarius indigo]
MRSRLSGSTASPPPAELKHHLGRAKTKAMRVPLRKGDDEVSKVASWPCMDVEDTSNSATCFSSLAWSLASFAALWASCCAICFFSWENAVWRTEVGITGGSKIRRGSAMRGGWPGGGRGRWAGEEEEGLYEEDDEELETRSDDRDSLAKGLSVGPRLIPLALAGVGLAMSANFMDLAAEGVLLWQGEGGYVIKSGD